MDKKYVGTFHTEQGVFNEIEKLKAQGYTESDIYVISNNQDDISMLRGRVSADTLDAKTTENRGWMDKFMDFLSGEEPVRGAFTDMGFSDEESTRFYNEARDGGILVFVDRDYGDKFSSGVTYDNTDAINEDGMSLTTPVENQGLGETVNRADTYDTTTNRDFADTDLTEEQRLRLHEEKLLIDKDEVQTGEVNVSKHTVTEQQSVDVPVTREEVYVERRPVDGEYDASSADFNDNFNDDETIHIPVTEEKVEVSKRPVVNEEIVVGKRKVTDTETVNETVRSEKADIDEDTLSASDRFDRDGKTFNSDLLNDQYDDNNYDNNRPL
ncbi:DUF2382 domain-containing protein [Chungangia koreensis]|uniref:DUF2382 domain-containing protein n=1 Tax=Chungangia koreensis TaxID=752657 RepID=A0ABV8X371_9LACT